MIRWGRRQLTILRKTAGQGLGPLSIDSQTLIIGVFFFPFFLQTCLQTLKIVSFFIFWKSAGGSGWRGRVTQSLVHKQECIVRLKAMGSISVFQSGFFFKEVEAQRLKGAGYLILPEQTCNVQGRVETMAFCSRLNPFDLSADSVMAYKRQ